MNGRLRHIVAAVDLSERSRPVILRAACFAEKHEAQLSLIHTVDDEYPEALAHLLRVEAEAALSRLASEAGSAAANAQIAVLRGRPHAAIASYCEEHRADLLVIGPQRDDPLWSLFRGRMADRLLSTLEDPIVVARQPSSAEPRHLLAAVDFSVASRSALAFAAKLAPAAKVSFLHVFDLAKASFVHGSALARYESQTRARATSELETLLRDLALASRVHEKVIARGDPVETILGEVQRLGADLLVLGTHGRTGIGRALVGSVALAVLGRAQSDVLVTRAW